MATPAQIRANRANAQLSSGPRSAEGKAAVRFNAWKHGADAESLIVPGEDPAALAGLTCQYYEQFQPAGPVETALLDTIIRADWNQRRFARIEAEIVRTLIAGMEPSENALGAAFHQDAAGANALQKLFRRQQAAQRDWRNALADLRYLQAQRPAAADPPPAAEPNPPAAPSPVVVPTAHLHPLAPPTVPTTATAPALPAKGVNWLGSEPPGWRL
jgi:hypothetical protein